MKKLNEFFEIVGRIFIICSLLVMLTALCCVLYEQITGIVQGIKK